MGENRKNRPEHRDLSPMMAAFSNNESILHKFLRRFTSNAHDIEDITQETVLRALKAEKSKEIEEPRAFLFGIARNVARKHLDKQSKSIIDFVEDYAPQNYVANDVPFENNIEARERMVLFGEALATLPAQCQKVFILKKVYGYSHQEISKTLGLSISTTEKHVASGLRRCSEFMKQKTEDVTSGGQLSYLKNEMK